jgi:DNA primase
VSGHTITVSGRELKITNTEKVLYPEAGFTKGDVIAYYRTIAPVLLPHLRGRALTMKRYPNGVDEEAFYQKESPKHRPDWVTPGRSGARETAATSTSRSSTRCRRWCGPPTWPTSSCTPRWPAPKVRAVRR